VFRRGGEFTVAVNPSFTPATVDIPDPGEQVLGRDTTHEAGRLQMDRFSYAIYKSS
jgi:maltose alpha-D-glucosyltransferase/alpha-amylase